MTRLGGSFGRLLAGASMLLALTAMTLVLTIIAFPVPGQAAPVYGPADAGNQSDISAAMTYTAYLPFISRPEASTPNVWFAEYYSNMNLNGEPTRTVDEKRVDYDWGEGGPEGLPKDFFSARWTGDWEFEYGEYTFWLDADDGVRLWLDDKLLIDVWQSRPNSETATVIVERKGQHRLKLEYYEERGVANVRLHWRRTDLYPRWEGEYYRLPWVETGKAYEQVDDAVQFEWGDDCPVGLPCDGFSILWKARPVFLTGTNHIYIYADDGYQLQIDGNTVKEGSWYEWQDGGRQDDYYELELDQVEEHDVIFKFQDRGGPAEARLWIQNMEQDDWTVEYYNNMGVGGAPSATKTDPAIFHDWKWDKPHRSVYSDHFSVRWSGKRSFDAGCYRFGLFADDGVRLYVDGELLIDEWHDGRDEYYSPVTYLDTGEHDLIIEYYENEGEAEVRFWW